MPIVQYIRRNLTYACAFDTRSIAIFRMALAATILTNIFTYLYWSNAFLAPDGVLPISAIPHNSFYWSFFDINQSLFFQKAVFIIGAFSAIALFIGWHARAQAIFLLFLHISIEHRFMITGGTVGIRMALLWAIFLPLAHSWSLQTLDTKAKHASIISGGTIAFTLQIVILYIAAAAHKHNIEWTTDYSAVYKSLWWGGLSQPLGEIIREYPALTRLLTKSTLFFEYIAPLALIIPIGQPLVRCIGVIILVCLNAGFQLTMALEPYTYANIAISLVFIPTAFWDFFLTKSTMYNRTIIQSQWYQLFPLFIVSLLLWKNLWHFSVLPKPPNILYNPLIFMKLTEKWDMFSGGNRYFRFWPYVQGVTQSNTVIDPWKWYLGLPNTFTPIVEPRDVSALTPNLRWDKYLTNITLNNSKYAYFQPYFLEFICKQYNQYNDDKLLNVTLGWGFQEIPDFTVFNEITTRDLREYQCSTE